MTKKSQLSEVEARLSHLEEEVDDVDVRVRLSLLEQRVDDVFGYFFWYGFLCLLTFAYLMLNNGLAIEWNLTIIVIKLLLSLIWPIYWLIWLDNSNIFNVLSNLAR